jgi:hypothetical protein
VQRAAAILAAAVAVVATGAAAGVPDPKPVAGSPLGRTGLRLLVADTTPFVLDVDTGRSSRVRAIPALTPLLWVTAVGRGAVVVQGAGEGRLYGVDGDGRVASLGRGANAWPAADGRTAWIQSRAGERRCTLRRVGLGGRVVRGRRPFPCATASDPGGELGLVVGRTRVVDPGSGRTIRRTSRGILAVAGTTLVLGGRGGALTLLDAETGAERDLPSLETLQGPGRAAVDPTGRFVVVEYASPAWNRTGTQVVDLWLVDTRAGPASRLPGMPAVVRLKLTEMAWTADGRFVVLGEDGRGGFVAVWRPGEKRLALKRVRLPERAGGSDSFAVLG